MKSLKKYYVSHNVLEIDRYVFPGCKSGIFYRPKQWPKNIIEELLLSEKIANKYSLKLLKGEINLEEDVTVLEIEAESENHIKNYYKEWEIKVEFLKIEENELCENFRKKKNVERNEFYKDTIRRGDLPLFKANKLMDKLEIGLEKLKKKQNYCFDDE